MTTQPLNATQQANLAAIQAQAPTFAALLPTPQQSHAFLESLLVYVSARPELLLCTPRTLLDACYKAATAGIRPGNGIDITARNRKLKSGATIAEAQCLIGTDAMVEISQNNGLTLAVGAAVVRDGDEFNWDPASSTVTHHHFTLKTKRGPIIGAYGWAILASGHKVYALLDREALDKRMAMSQSAVPREWEEEWCIKTAIRNVYQRRLVVIKNPDMTADTRRQMAAASYGHLLPSRTAPALPAEPAYTEAQPTRALTYSPPDDVPVYDVTPEPQPVTVTTTPPTKEEF